MAKIILISGKAENGKTEVAKILRSFLENKGFRVTFTPFASYLKFICKEHYGWNGKKDEVGRSILQHVGTNVIRKRRPDFWVNTTLQFIDAFEEEFDFFIADDVRFKNEIDATKGSGFESISIRVERLNFENSLNEEQRQHLSETALDKFDDFDYYVESESGKENLNLAILKGIFLSDNFKTHLFFN